MKLSKRDSGWGRGFPQITHPAYPNSHQETVVVQMSTAIGDYPDAMDKPGSSYLHLGFTHNLSREDVAEFVMYLQRWLDTGTLAEKEGMSDKDFVYDNGGTTVHDIDQRSKLFHAAKRGIDEQCSHLVELANAFTETGNDKLSGSLRHRAGQIADNVDEMQRLFNLVIEGKDEAARRG